MEKRIFSVKDLSEYLGIGRNAAYSLVHMRGFPCIKIGNRILIPEFELVNWLANGARTNETIVLRKTVSNNVKTGGKENAIQQ